MKLKGKIIIKGIIEVRTGLHVGGSKASLKIGGIDNNVIKTMQGKPYIPGSSLKGKLRSLLAKKSGTLFFSEDEKERFLRDFKKENTTEIEIFRKADTDEAVAYIIELFGYSGDTKEKNQVGTTRLLVRDAHLINANDTEVFPSKTESEPYVISKFENVINRRTGTAEHPRQMERVPVGAKFGLELVYNVFDDMMDWNRHLNQLLTSLRLLQDDFIGGQGSRGYGQVKVTLNPDASVLRWIIEDQYVDTDWEGEGYNFTSFRAQLNKI